MRPKRGTTLEDVYQKIKNLMYKNELAPGQKLIYQDLAKKFNTSTTPVLQALGRLENAKLVRYEPNKGYFVGEITEEEARQLYQAREALEVYILPSIVNNVTPDELDRIIHDFTDHKSTIKPPYRGMMLWRDAQFHLKIAEYSYNQVIYDLLKDLFERIYLKYRPEYMINERLEEAFMHHRTLIETMKEKDVERAISLTRMHTQSGLEYVTMNLKTAKRISIYD